jgi:hypothetical protein
MPEDFYVSSAWYVEKTDKLRSERNLYGRKKKNVMSNQARMLSKARTSICLALEKFLNSVLGKRTQYFLI